MRNSARSIFSALGTVIVLCAALADDVVNLTEAGTDNDGTPDGQDAEEEFLKQLHYSHDDFVRIYDSLPRDEDNKVDWALAVSEGLISPAASPDNSDIEEMIMDLRVVIKFNDMLIKDVVFSHEVHTYWLNCDSCHPRVFKAEVASNRMTMQEIREGKYCGLCHGAVAFPTNVIDAPNFRANCLRCHRAQRG